MKRKSITRMFFLMTLVAVLCLYGGNLLYASSGEWPGSPPPGGKVWIKLESGWKLVPAPPSDAPYAWSKDRWEKITVIPPGREWVPAYWGKNGWVPAHWCPVVYPHAEAKWIPGYWDSQKQWIPGHWEGVVLPDKPRLDKQVWVPGHRVSNGGWVHGHWR
jgi:hypothetical protein